MALIPEGTKQRNAFLAILGAAAVVGGVYYFHYTPNTALLEEQQVRLEDLENSNRVARMTQIRGQDIEGDLAIFERHARRLEELIPSEEEVAGLLEDVSLTASRNGVELARLSPSAEEPGPFYTRRAYDIGVVGEYHDVGRFLTAVASLPRIVTPSQGDIILHDQDTFADRMTNPVQAGFTIETYVVSNLGELPPADMNQPGGDR